jgi:flavin-dependent dehydrogenase
MFDADLLVAGGGPAGLATALHALQSGLSVVIAEPRPNPIDKACGEGLMPGGLAALAQLGVDPPGVPFAGIAYIHGSRRAEARFRNGPGRGVRRTALHAALTAAAQERGAKWAAVRITDIAQDDSGVSAGGLRARWLVAADGLHSGVRRSLGIAAVPGKPRRFGVRWHFGSPAWSEFVEVWWSDRGEAYVTPVGPGQVGVAILSAQKPDLAWFPGLAERLGDGGSPRGAGPLRQVVQRRVAGRVLLVGDAAGYEDALTGEGISLAVKQAQAAVQAIVAGRPGSYERAWRSITRDYRLLTRGLVLATRPRAMRRAIVPICGAAPAIFRGVVNVLAR